MRRRTIDIVFTRLKIAVFMDGCFWHGCPQHATQPKSNGEWWRVKIATNRARDLETTKYLQSEGWTVFRFWEHEPSGEVARVVRESVMLAREPKDR